MKRYHQDKHQIKKKERHPVLSSFSIILIFIVFVLIGCALLPLLSIQLNPSRTDPSMNVTFQWPEASARLIEQEVTSKLEGLFGAIIGVQNINSVTSKGEGKISLTFKKNTNLDAVRFEVATLIRQAYPKLPEKVSYPLISLGSSGRKDQPILTYTLNGNASPYEIQKYAQEHIVPYLSVIPGVNEINVYGATPFEWQIAFDYDLSSQLNISAKEIQDAIQNYFQKEDIGLVFVRTSGTPVYKINSKASSTGDVVESPMRVMLKTLQPSHLNWQQIPIKNVDGRIVYLSDIASVEYLEQKPNAYFRINGLNTINLVIYPAEGVNHIRLADELNTRLSEINQNLPSEYNLLPAYNATQFIKEELRKIGFRTLFSMAILLAFVLLVSRQFRYLILIFISLIANLVIAVIFYYLFQIEIHLYSLAGITVSFGIIIDNTIVMVDHYRHHRDKKVLLAILAATLTTIGALSVIFFLEEKQRLNLIDFALVVMVNLGVSVIIALFFIPALMQKVSLKKLQNRRVIRRKRRIVHITKFYTRTIIFCKRFAWVFIILMILGFGLPVHWLPEKIEQESFWADMYNGTIGSEWYQGSARSTIEKVVGGTLRLFTAYVFESSFYQEPERTTLYVRGTMPEGCTVQQLNQAITKMENYVSQYNEVEMFQTNIQSYRNSSIRITFKPEYEFGSFPYFLQEALTSKAVSLGGLDWSVYGVGRGFSNALSTGFRNSSIKLEGYNYDDLYAYAEQLKSKLQKNPRIKEIDIQGDQGWRVSNLHEYYLEFDKAALAHNDIDLVTFYDKVNDKVYFNSLPPVFRQHEPQPVSLVTANKEYTELWHFKYQPLNIRKLQGSDENIKDENSQEESLSKTYQQYKTVKLNNVATIEKQKSGNDIYKYNQQYQLYLLYDFIGPEKLSQIVREDFIEEVKPILPLGYNIEDGRKSFDFWNKKEKGQYYLIFLVIIIIYFVCSILLESFRQPLAIIAMVPISFIGVFLTFYLFDLNFDQGGFASFILLSGIAVNSGLYIINDFNNLKKKKPTKGHLNLYLKAFNQKIIPVLLTILSTALGLIPFIWQGQNEVFWFSFASGVIGGLFFSLVAVYIYLPLFIKL